MQLTEMYRINVIFIVDIFNLYIMSVHTIIRPSNHDKLLIFQIIRAFIKRMT